MEAGSVANQPDSFSSHPCERCGELTPFRPRQGPGAHKFYENICDKCRIELRVGSRRAMGEVAKAIKKGHLVRPDRCEICQNIPGPMSNGRSQIVAHHADGHEHPLKIWWLCHHCNQQLKGYKYHCGQVSFDQARAILGVGALSLERASR